MKAIKLFIVFIRHLYHLIRFKTLSDEQIRREQFKKLKNLIDFAWNHIPFYQELWGKAGFNPSLFKSIDDISLIPCIDKNMVRENYEKMVPDNYHKSKLTLVTTGGTTGVPMNFYINKLDAQTKEFAFQLWRNYCMWGYKQCLDKVVILRGNRISPQLIGKHIFWQKGRLENALICSSFHLTEQNYNSYLNKIRAFKPRFIKAYPSSIALLCSLMKKHGDAKIETLQGIICSSENVYDWQRKLVKEVLDVEILSFYGHSEKAVWAFQNSQQKLLFHPLYSYTEFLNKNFQTIEAVGEIAQVVVTSFDNKYFPFIRYLTSDYVEVGESILHYPKVANRIIGREQEFVYDKNSNKVIFTCSDELLWGIDGVIAYQYRQQEVGKLILCLQVNEQFTIPSIEKILGIGKSIFVDFDLLVEIVDYIPKTSNGKFRYLIQNIK